MSATNAYSIRVAAVQNGRHDRMGVVWNRGLRQAEKFAEARELMTLARKRGWARGPKTISGGKTAT